jgi:hypothetical protein
MPAHDRRLPLALAAIALLAAVACARLGLDADALIAVPGLLLLIPLVAGRYVGSDGLVWLAARRVPRRRRSPAAAVARWRPHRCVMPRGGRLVAASLARRGPPQSVLAR